MRDLIDRKATVDRLKKERSFFKSSEQIGIGLDIARMIIEERVPSTQPERKKGKWIKNDNGTYSCDQCHSWIPNEQHYYARYCIFCGAPMEVEE